MYYEQGVLMHTFTWELEQLAQGIRFFVLAAGGEGRPMQFSLPVSTLAAALCIIDLARVGL